MRSDLSKIWINREVVVTAYQALKMTLEPMGNISLSSTQIKAGETARAGLSVRGSVRGSVPIEGC